MGGGGGGGAHTHPAPDNILVQALFEELGRHVPYSAVVHPSKRVPVLVKDTRNDGDPVLLVGAASNTVATTDNELVVGVDGWLVGKKWWGVLGV